MRFHCACVMAFLPVMATVIDATVWFGDHKEFPITNAIAMVERELKPRHIDKAVYLSVSAHKEIKDLRWSGLVLADGGGCDERNALVFSVYKSGHVEISDAGSNYMHDLKNMYPSYSIDKVLELYRKSGRDVNDIVCVESDEYPTNVVWVAWSSPAEKVLFDENSSNIVRVIHSKPNLNGDFPDLDDDVVNRLLNREALTEDEVARFMKIDCAAVWYAVGDNRSVSDEEMIKCYDLMPKELKDRFRENWRYWGWTRDRQDLSHHIWPKQ